MANYQNTASDGKSLLLGSARLEVAASAGVAASQWTNLGLCRGIKFAETITPYNVQADNGPDPIQGISEQICNITAELMEPLKLSNINTMRGGIDSYTSSTSAGTYITGSTTTILKTGGFQEMTPIAAKLTNLRIVSGATVETVLVVYKVTAAKGIELNFASDNADDPISTMAIELKGEQDTARSAGDQLYRIETEATNY